MRAFDSLETPCLLIDKVKLESNTAAMRNRCAGLGVALRPHVKTPKSLEIARITHGGALGPITVSTLLEAEYFARAGYADILYAVAIVPAKLPRVAAIERDTGTRVKVVLDSVAMAEAAAHFVRETKNPLDVLIEIDSGEHRSGVEPTDPAIDDIARTLAGVEGLRLAGVMTHAGHSYGSDDPAELRRIAGHERDTAIEAARRLRAQGHAVPIVSVGSTPTIMFADHLQGVSEARCGIYAVWDLAQASRRICRIDEIAVSVLASVIGHNRTGGSIVVDAGALALSKDIGANKFMPSAQYGLVCDATTCAPLEGLRVAVVHQEHGTVPVSDAAWFERLPIGSLVRILPNHACLTCAAYDAYNVLENGRITGRWSRINGW